LVAGGWSESRQPLAVGHEPNEQTMGMRRKGRELAVQALYQLEIRNEPSAEKMLAAFWEQCEAGPRARAFAQQLIDGVRERREAIDAVIEQTSENWKLDRLSTVDLSVLRVACYELMFAREVPVSVVLDEAIEVARRFGTTESAVFVNGVLDRIAANLGVKPVPPEEAEKNG
jgi:N utilization substance protein B